jgi:hypothetical protein
VLASSQERTQVGNAAIKRPLSRRLRRRPPGGHDLIDLNTVIGIAPGVVPRPQQRNNSGVRPGKSIPSSLPQPRTSLGISGDHRNGRPVIGLLSNSKPTPHKADNVVIRTTERSASSVLDGGTTIAQQVDGRTTPIGHGQSRIGQQRVVVTLGLRGPSSVLTSQLLRSGFGTSSAPAILLALLQLSGKPLGVDGTRIQGELRSLVSGGLDGSGVMPTSGRLSGIDLRLHGGNLGVAGRGNLLPDAQEVPNVSRLTVKGGLRSGPHLRTTNGHGLVDQHPVINILGLLQPVLKEGTNISGSAIKRLLSTGLDGQPTSVQDLPNGDPVISHPSLTKAMGKKFANIGRSAIKGRLSSTLDDDPTSSHGLVDQHPLVSLLRPLRATSQEGLQVTSGAKQRGFSSPAHNRSTGLKQRDGLSPIRQDVGRSRRGERTNGKSRGNENSVNTQGVPPRIVDRSVPISPQGQECFHPH